MVPYIWTKKFVKNVVKKDQLCAVALMNRKWILRPGFTQNGCYGSQSQPLEVLVDSTDANNPCPFTKQDLIFKQAYLVGFCFVLFNKLKFWQLVHVSTALYRLYLERTLFCTKPSEQIVYCHVADLKMLKNFSLLNNETIGLWLPQISGIYL